MEIKLKPTGQGNRYKAWVYAVKKFVIIPNATSYNDAYNQIIASGLFGEKPKICWYELNY